MCADGINPLKHDEAGADVKAAWVSTKLLCAAHCFLVFRLADDPPITNSLIGRCPASQPKKKIKAIPSVGFASTAIEHMTPRNLRVPRDHRHPPHDNIASPKPNADTSIQSVLITSTC